MTCPPSEDEMTTQINLNSLDTAYITTLADKRHQPQISAQACQDENP